MQENCRIQREVFVIGIILLFVGGSLLPIGSTFAITKDALAMNDSSSMDWWPMFHHDLTHSGYSTSVAPKTNHVTWMFQTEAIILSCPIVVNEKVYFGSNQKYYCLNAETGETIWVCLTNGWAEGNPAIENGKFYAVSRNQEGENKLFCLNATTGQYLWNYTNCYWPFNPVVYENKVYFGSLDGVIRCLDGLTGALVWSYSTGAIGTSNAPAISDGNVYIGAENGNMYCLDATNGNKIWNYTTNGKIMESAAVANGKVYFGSCDFKIYCLDVQNGHSIWDYTTGYYVDSTPAIAYNKIFIGSRDCNLYCLDAASGGYQWIYTADGQVDSSPAVADGKVYVGSDDGRVYCFDAETGGKQWDYMTGGLVASSPAIADGKVYVGSYDTYVYCFGDEPNENQPPNPPTITGPATAKIKVPVNYNFTTTDPDGDNLSYFIDWGDGTNSSWIGPYISGEQITQSHTWNNKGNYTIKAKAKDSLGAESDWGQLSVTMPFSYNIPFLSFWQKIFERFPHVFPILRQMMGY